MRKKILFLVPYPLEASPSQRFRFEQYFEILKKQGFDLTIQSFLNSDNWRVFYERGHPFRKIGAIVTGFAKRIIALFISPMYDFVFIHREAAPIGPPVFEWIIAKIFRKKIIYDFDDAIWLTDRDKESWVFSLAKQRAKVAKISRWAHKISCGNEYLCDYAAQFNMSVVCNPTTIDTHVLHNPARYDISISRQNKVRIGWTGSHSTLKYLDGVESTIKKILNDYPYVEFVVIADRKPTLDSLPVVTFIEWNPYTEIIDLMQLDVGIMPLPDDIWAKGKCGFKALQYMALEIPAVVSPVGVNTKIVEHDVNGFLCSTPEEWEIALKRLVEDSALRKKFGINGRQKIIEYYSVNSNTSTFLSLFE